MIYHVVLMFFLQNFLNFVFEVSPENPKYFGHFKTPSCLSGPENSMPISRPLILQLNKFQ